MGYIITGRIPGTGMTKLFALFCTIEAKIILQNPPFFARRRESSSFARVCRRRLGVVPPAASRLDSRL